VRAPTGVESPTCSFDHCGLLNEAGENRRRFHRVGMALLAIAGVLVGLHLARKVAAFVHADGRRDGIGEHRLQQFFDAVVALDLDELGANKIIPSLEIVFGAGTTVWRGLIRICPRTSAAWKVVDACVIRGRAKTKTARATVRPYDEGIRPIIPRG
jgi:hypothetical protein